ncbi:MAG: ribonuclease HI family protein [Thermomicrobium sp.]|nr:ribonuclease HI family protein [Thermomicrobium sp.]
MDSAGGAQLQRCVVIFDGGSRGNPGPAYGSFRLECDSQEPITARIDFVEELTNNQAEYRTLIAALEALLRTLQEQQRAAGDIWLEIRTDSELVARQLTGAYRVRDAKLQPLFERVRTMLARFGGWEVHWQPRDVIYRYFGH